GRRMDHRPPHPARGRPPRRGALHRRPRALREEARVAPDQGDPLSSSRTSTRCHQLRVLFRSVGEDASETGRIEMTQGVLYVHSAPRALTPHIEWAASGVLGVPARIRWEDQPAMRGLQRAEMTWRGREDTGARLVSALRGMHEVRFEVTQEATAQLDGARWSCTPELGIHHAATDHAGNTVLTEDRV